MPKKTPKTKVCTKCGKRKQARYFGRDCHSKDGHQSDCKKCHNATSHRWYRTNVKSRAEYNRRSVLMKKYGITPEQYDAMLKAQKGVCGICGRSPKTRRLGVDHDHKTGRVRGLLCHVCNQALGYLRNNPDSAKAAARFLSRKKAKGLS